MGKEMFVKLGPGLDFDPLKKEETVSKSRSNVGLEKRWYRAETGNYPLVNEATCQSKDVIVQCENGYMFIAYLDGSYADIVWLSNDDGQQIADVIAWHPLPEPIFF